MAQHENRAQEMRFCCWVAEVSLLVAAKEAGACRSQDIGRKTKPLHTLLFCHSFPHSLLKQSRFSCLQRSR